MIIPIASEAEWHAIRLKHVGGSESAALMGCQEDYQLSAFALWQVKSGRIPPPEVTGPRIEAGKRLEGAIAEWIAFGENWKIEQFKGYAECDSFAGMGCTPDFRILNREEGVGLLQIKNVDSLVHKRKWTNGEPPMSVLIQVQHEMHSTGLKYCYVGALVGGNEPVTYRVDYRPKIGAEIEKRVRAFWDSIKAGQEPAVDGSDTTAAALAAMYPEAEPAKAIDLTQDNEFAIRWGAFKQARMDRQAAEKSEQSSKNWIMAKIGDAELIRYNGAIVGTAKTQHRKAYSVKESSSRVLRTKDD